MRQSLERIWCGLSGHRHTHTHVRNLYGDEIIEYGWSRSIWKCSGCGAYLRKDQLA